MKANQILNFTESYDDNVKQEMFNLLLDVTPQLPDLVMALVLIPLFWSRHHGMLHQFHATAA